MRKTSSKVEDNVSAADLAVERAKEQADLDAFWQFDAPVAPKPIAVASEPPPSADSEAEKVFEMFAAEAQAKAEPVQVPPAVHEDIEGESLRDKLARKKRERQAVAVAEVPVFVLPEPTGVATFEGDPDVPAVFANFAMAIATALASVSPESAVDADQAAHFETYTGACCVVVKSAQFTGYLLCATLGGGSLQDDLGKHLSEILPGVMSTQNLALEIIDVIKIDFPELDFVAWSRRNGQFLGECRIQDSQTAIAFCEAPQIEMPFVASTHPSLREVKLSDMAGNATVNFDVQVYLPLNKKLVRITKDNGTLYAKQIEKLKNFGVESIQIGPTDDRAMRAYRARQQISLSFDKYRAEIAANPPPVEIVEAPEASSTNVVEMPAKTEVEVKVGRGRRTFGRLISRS